MRRLGRVGEAPREPEAPQTPPIDPVRLEYALQLLRSEQNLVLGVVGGAVAAAVGAAGWAAVAAATGYQLGIVAVAIGLLVGWTVRALGKGVDRQFGVAGGILALGGCVLGNLLAVCAIVAAQEGLPLREVLDRLDAASAGRLLAASFRPGDLVFYAIAVYEGYRLSFRQLSREELAGLVGPL